MAQLHSIVPIVPHLYYVAKGSELDALDTKLRDIYSDISVVRGKLYDALCNLSQDPNSVPKFVAQVGIAFSELDKSVTIFKSMGLLNLAAGMNFEVDESQFKADPAEPE